ncbi:MAG TPA: hypothetical protein ENI69_03660, partial [Rhodospirillales bacterium]|nr:hypothetical protein [Rhodospirillales bacterium]
MGPISFLSPLALLGLAAVPLLWWLLRLTPPAPRTLEFPPIMILLRLLPGRQISAHSPLWLLLLRLTLLLAIIFAAADPVLNPANRLFGEGPLSLVIDEGWAAAKNWNLRRQALTRLIEQAGREDRSVILARTSQPAAQIMSASAAARVVADLLPKPWSVDRKPVLESLQSLLVNEPPGPIVWLSDGIGDEMTDAQINALAGYGDLSIIADRPRTLPVILSPADARRAQIQLTLSRLQSRQQGSYRLLARDAGGALLASLMVSIRAGERV